MWEFFRSSAASRDERASSPFGVAHSAAAHASSAGGGSLATTSNPIYSALDQQTHSSPHPTTSAGGSEPALVGASSAGGSPTRSPTRRGPLTQIDTAGHTSVSTKLGKVLTATVVFRDVTMTSTLVPHEEASVQEEESEHPSGVGSPMGYATLVTGVQKNKLIIIMVGLPARGKTFLCNKIMRYLNWLGHQTRHFNVGQYRRHLNVGHEVQDASFFDPHNEAGLEARNRALHAALDDMLAWLEQDDSQVAIFDATNSTEERRRLLRLRFHNRWQYLMIETICSDEEVLHANYMMKMQYSPDYTDYTDAEQALTDFKARIKKYEEVYETITDRSYHFIRLTDITTGRGHLDVNRISGFIPGKLVLFLMQVCKAGTTRERRIFLTRHGQSEYNRTERLGGDSSISSDGERYAALLPAALLSRLPQDTNPPLSVWTSTLRRTIQTARSLPFPKLQWKALDEIDAGACDGMTYEEISQRMPNEFQARKKDKLRYRYPEGESYLDVVQRLEPVITEMEREREYVCVVSHQAVLRVVYGYFMGVPQEQIPSLEIPLHTLIELTPMPDGSMHEQRFKVDITRGPDQFVSQQYEEARPGSPEGSEASCDSLAAMPPAPHGEKGAPGAALAMEAVAAGVAK